MTLQDIVRKSAYAAAMALCIGLALGAGTAGASAEASSFGCANLDTDTSLPTVEGKNGFFFRYAADLRMQHPMTDEVIDQLAALSAALKSKGTTLIYVPVPTKSQTMPTMLPDEARLFGYDKDVAQAVYNDLIARLSARGVLSVNLMQALQSGDPDNPPFYKTDFHWTSHGARLAAQAVSDVIRAQPEYGDLPTSKFESVALGEQTNFSTMRLILQRYCKKSLPPVRSVAYETREVEQAAGGLDIFGGAGGEAPMALVGTSFSDLESANFGGFLSEFTGLSLSNQAVTGGNQFGSITSYFTSRSFEEARPRFLLWENPIYNNLAPYGAGPIVELITAAGGRCTMLPADTVQSDASANTLTVDLKSTRLEASDVVFTYAGDEASRKMELDLQLANGEQLADSIERNPRMQASGRFYLPVEPLWTDNLAKMIIKFDRLVPDQAEVGICKT